MVIIGYHLPTFSQTTRQLQLDSTSVKIGFNNNTKTFGILDTLDYKQFLNKSEPHTYLLKPKMADKNVHIGKLYNGKIKTAHAIDNMPCLDPQGSFPMKIYKPDSSFNYTLLIKKH
jgi:hypothetical protein